MNCPYFIQEFTDDVNVIVGTVRHYIFLKQMS